MSSIGNELEISFFTRTISLLVIMKNGFNKIILHLACKPNSLLNCCFRSHSLPHCQPTGIRNLAHTKMRSPNHYLELGVPLTSSVFANVPWVFLCECFYCYCFCERISFLQLIHIAAAVDFSLFFDSCYLPKGTPWIFSVLPKVRS